MPPRDWTTGPAKHAAGGFVGGAATIGLIWAVTGRTPQPQPAPPAPVIVIQPQTQAPSQPLGTVETVKQPESVAAETEPQQPEHSVVSIPFDTDPVVRTPEGMPAMLVPPVSVPAPGRTKVVDDVDDRPSAVLLINVNTATGPELETLPGIGPKYAQRIIDDRQKNGPFRSIIDLQRVRGIGPKTAKKLEPLIRFE